MGKQVDLLRKSDLNGTKEIALPKLDFLINDVFSLFFFFLLTYVRWYKLCQVNSRPTATIHFFTHSFPFFSLFIFLIFSLFLHSPLVNRMPTTASPLLPEVTSGRAKCKNIHRYKSLYLFFFVCVCLSKLVLL